MITTFIVQSNTLSDGSLTFDVIAQAYGDTLKILEAYNYAHATKIASELNNVLEAQP